jgi:SAM-dependent MidA family methyltransferase
VPETALQAALVSRIRERGPLTVAAFMDAALHHPTLGYYARAAQRSGRAGDFYTSVDVGPMFGQMLARLVVATWHALGQPAPFQIVEVGAGNGRLARDVLDALARTDPGCYRAVAFTLVESSVPARDAHAATLAVHEARVLGSRGTLPEGRVAGLIYANELLDAMPVHRVRITPEGLREVYVAETEGRLHVIEGRPSTPRLAHYVARLGVRLEEGTVADIGLAAVEWTGIAARALARGYLLLIDYGDRAERLYGGARPRGTLRAFTRHMVDALPGAEPWLHDPGEQDLTASVNFSAIDDVLAGAGLRRIAFVDQTRFLLALGLADAMASLGSGRSTDSAMARLSARTLVDPEGLGGSHKALLAATASAPELSLPFQSPWAAS